jgi:hypothetical protein
MKKSKTILIIILEKCLYLLTYKIVNNENIKNIKNIKTTLFVPEETPAEINNKEYKTDNNLLKNPISLQKYKYIYMKKSLKKAKNIETTFRKRDADSEPAPTEDNCAIRSA